MPNPSHNFTKNFQQGLTVERLDAASDGETAFFTGLLRRAMDSRGVAMAVNEEKRRIADSWIPPARREPDFNQLLKVLNKQKPDRPTLFEIVLNDRLCDRLAGHDVAERLKKIDQTTPEGALEANSIRNAHAFRNAGYDYATFRTQGLFRFPAGERRSDSSASLNEGFVISDRDSFERYPWPDPDASAITPYMDLMAAEMGPGMKLMPCLPAGVLENMASLLGYDNLCFLTVDDPELLRNVADAVGSRLLRYTEMAVRHPATGVMMLNDDWGFATQTRLAPADMRKYVFPWHKRMVAAAHAAGRPAVLHSCGCFAGVIEDIIEDMRFDGRHSYEDKILPVEDAYDRYGGRIAILGGIDIDFMCRAPLAEVTARSRRMVERAAAAHGGYGLGTGNSVPSYMADERYLAMVDAVIER